MRRSTWIRATLAAAAALAMVFAGLSGCKSESEPVDPDPEPVVAVPAEAPPPAQGPALEEVEEGMTPAEQQELSTVLATEAKAEITAENAAQELAAIEAELAGEPAED